VIRYRDGELAPGPGRAAAARPRPRPGRRGSGGPGAGHWQPEAWRLSLPGPVGSSSARRRRVGLPVGSPGSESPLWCLGPDRRARPARRRPGWARPGPHQAYLRDRPGPGPPVGPTVRWPGNSNLTILLDSVNLTGRGRETMMYRFPSQVARRIMMPPPGAPRGPARSPRAPADQSESAQMPRLRVVTATDNDWPGSHGHRRDWPP
jgi:hypothetical protein